MSLQNRVTPFGDIVAIPQRGMFTGNRGLLHDPATKTLTRRRWTSKAWLICVCDYQGRRRKIMGARSWTELFFLDEAVALAAGHRPCFLCRREDAERFRRAWATGNGGPPPSASAIDADLHRQRWGSGEPISVAPPSPISQLPNGAMVQADGAAFTIFNGRSYRWTPEGYAPQVTLAAADRLLTPHSTLAALKTGYRPILHPDLIRMDRAQHV